MRNHLPLTLIALFTCLLASAPQLARADEDPAGVRVDFPTGGDLPYDKLGVYIGIDSYSKLPINLQLHGCVPDAMAYKEAFLRLGVQRYAMLTNGHATRSEIGLILAELIEQVKIAKTKTHGPITVVITYAGHGCRLKRLPMEDDPTTDSSWVAADSDYVGTNDIRGYELLQIHTELAKLGAQVILISDSCHSAHIYRGGEDDGQSRTLDGFSDDPKTNPPRGGYDTRLGPQADLFPQFPLPKRDVRAASANPDSGPLPGFVDYSACGDDQSAYETADDQGHPCGKLSFVMRTLLSHLGQDTTYQELASKVYAEFVARWGDRLNLQTPEFHAGEGKGDELFFKGGYPPTHADIVAGTQQNGTLQLTMGSVLGVAPGSHFTFYANLDDLAARRNPVATAEVEQVYPLTCRVKLDNLDKISPDACALLNPTSIADFVLSTDETDAKIPQFVWDKLHELANDKQISLVSLPTPCTAVLRYDPANKVLDLYSPDALPPRGMSDSSAPTLRPSMPCAGPDDTDAIAQNLLYAARIQRLMSLEHNDDGLLKADIQVQGPAARSANGLTEISENDDFSIRLTNPSDKPMFFTVLAIDKVGNVQILYPSTGADDEGVRPGAFVDVDLQAQINDRAALKPGEAEITQVKIIATSDRVDIAPLVVPPVTGAANVHTRGFDNNPPAFDLMRDVLHGGPLASNTRGVGPAMASEHFATATVVFGVVPSTPPTPEGLHR